MISTATNKTEEEKQEILRRYRKLLKHAKPYLKGDDAKMIKKAFNTALEAHKDMRRKTGEPYIYHPISVAQIAVEEIGLGPTSIIAALLHDVVEDTDWTIEEIKETFGLKVSTIIDGLTKISGVSKQNTSTQAENFRKVLLTISDDLRVILIKLADRLHNMRTLESMPRNKQLKIASETKYIYAPLAHRLGLYAIKSELEDLCLKYNERDIYKEIAIQLKSTKALRDKFISDFIKPIKKILKESGFKFTIKGRPKSIYSIWRKMQKQNIPFDKVYDLFAVRIILDTPTEEEKASCWKVYSIITDFYKPNPDRLRDWISTPKSNGYESLHTTVMSKSGQWVEVQIRSVRMDEIAEKGYAAHWKYKDASKKTKQESSLDQWVNKVRDMIENNDISALEFVDDFKNNLFQDEVFIFTPKGDLKVLPFGASTLDFAFDIHSEVGYHCIGAKVNNKLVPLSHQLNNGDQVEILTSSKQKPNEGWLKFVVSSKARAKIREALREENKAYAKEGRILVEKKLKQLKLGLDDIITNHLVAYFNEKSSESFFSKIGKGLITVKELKKFKEYHEELDKNKKLLIQDAKTFSTKIRDSRNSDDDVLLIGEDQDKLDYTLAACCNPIPGDDVFGFVTINYGIKVHRTSCPNATELMSKYGYRIIKARWASSKDEKYIVQLKLTGTDRVGIINDVTKIISNELEVNIRSIQVDTKDGIFEGNFMVVVYNTDHLKLLIDKLKNVNGVEDIMRFDSKNE